MNLHSAVERAMEYTPGDDELDPTSFDYSIYQSRSDDYVIHLNREDVCAGNVVYTEATDGPCLELIFAATGDVRGRPVDSDYIDYAVRHERQHFDAAKMLGATSARYGVKFYTIQSGPDQETKIDFHPLFMVRDLRTTKLGAALISAYPILPSKGDVRDVESIGYSGVEELADIAISRNMRRKQDSDIFYPVPLSSSLPGVSLDTRQWMTPEAAMLENFGTRPQLETASF